MTRQEYKKEAIKTVKRLIARHAAASSLFDEMNKKGSTDNATYFLEKMEQYEKEILEYI